MDGGSHSLSLSSENEDSSPQSNCSLLVYPEEHEATVESRPEKEPDEVVPEGERLLSNDDQRSLITDSMSVTSADQEKLLLLNQNTELRRVNKELMKLNEDWDNVYRTTTLSLQQRLEAVEEENNTFKQLHNRLALTVDHEQSKREYYEHTLMQELKKNQHLLEYVRVLETRLHHTDAAKDWKPRPQTSLGNVSPERRPISHAPGVPNLSPSLSHSTMSLLSTPTFGPGRSPGATLHRSSSPLLSSFTPDQGCRHGRSCFSVLEEPTNPQKEVKELKDQLEALRCQTEIYEADYQTEHKDHKHTLQENKRLRKKKEEMRQQMALLQEQLKVYEDDFRKERSDKQVLQRLLLKKSPGSGNKEPVLVHRCNNGQPPVGGDKERQREKQRGAQPHPDSAQTGEQHHPLCPKHCERRRAEDFP
ncbi:hypothetical protein UPYG_G00211120 [Umbra pygmaea]|uniref:Uncharacterized protein n=1 Tax=Umbra pygmaea TaxID=75934 RepID=A0ABD0WPS8_UMBPY